jgi:AcrR family transcriptional regulator
MTAVTDRPLRADAARNAERILRAAREIYGEFGPDAPIEAIARRAGVGERTLYRRFPTKAELIRAALDQCIAEDLTPTIEAVRGADDPLHGLAQLIDAAISLGAREHNLLTAARRAGSLTPDISTSLYEALNELAHRGQQAGVVRADLVATACCGRWIPTVTAGVATSRSFWTLYPSMIDGRYPRQRPFGLRPSRAAGREASGLHR